MEDASLRDRLALERTRLANERTLLAYIRTALALLAGGAALLQFFPSYGFLIVLAWLFVACGGATILVGVRRFVQVKSRLHAGSTPRPL